MKKYYMKKEDLRRLRPNLRVIRNIVGINDGMAKQFYIDLDTCDVFRVDERYNSIRKNEAGQDYDLLLAHLATSRNKQGDLCVQINKRLYTIARIMASTGIENPSYYPDILHRDGSRDNNHIENLEWCTHKELVKSYYARKKAEEKPKKHVFKVEKEEQDVSEKTEAEKMIESLSKDFDWDSIVWSEG